MIGRLLQTMQVSPTPHVDGGTSFVWQVLVVLGLVVAVIVLYLLFRDH